MGLERGKGREGGAGWGLWGWDEAWRGGVGPKGGAVGRGGADVGPAACNEAGGGGGGGMGNGGEKWGLEGGTGGGNGAVGGK